MTATLLANELSSLISESKRKNNDLRNAAEKSLQELKSLSITSEQQLAGDLSRRQTFIDPFVIACRTQTAKYAGSGVACLQRLVVIRGLNRTRLKDAIEAFNACTGLGLDVQLKILQALPSLVQNYADELKDSLLGGTLQICSSLQAAKVQTISGVAAATLQQLISTVFEKVSKEDARASEVSAENSIPGDDGPIVLRPAAFDAYRIFRDLILVAGEREPKFVDFTSLSAETSLELIYSCVGSNPRLIDGHEELGRIVRSNVLPFITQALSGKSDFTVTVRCTRILRLVLLNHIAAFPGECEMALGLLAHGLDDASLGWKRCLFMEVLRDLFEKPDLVIKSFASFDNAIEGKPVIQDIMSSFVRLSADKPAIIGLGQQSTMPTGPTSNGDQAFEQAAIEAAGGMAGVISSALGVLEASVPGLSSQWSVPRTACIDQLDKHEPPSLPETYVYSLVLVCLSHLSDNLAKVVLPLSVRHEQSKGKPTTEEEGHSEDNNTSRHINRSQSFRRRAVPLNPLNVDGPVAPRIQAVASLVESCWPAVLATSSTFLNAALDDQYYRSLIKAYQRFAQVAGILRLSTPRDALITTLGKAAVPPQVLNAATIDIARSPTVESPRVFSNSRHLLSVDSLISQTSTTSSDRERRSSIEPSRQTLTIRNLLCLRALLNLAIALGPTLGRTFSVIVDVLKQADIVLSAVGPQQLVRQGTSLAAKGTESPAIVQAFSAEVAAVESAASRLLESTADYPDDSFLDVLETFCALVQDRAMATSPASPISSVMGFPDRPPEPRRTFSGLTGITTNGDLRIRDYQFAIPKLGNLASLNVSRFVSNPPAVSGWNTLVGTVTSVAITNSCPPGARRAAAGLLCTLANDCIAEVAESDSKVREDVQPRALGILLRIIDSIYAQDGDLTSTDIDVQCHVLESLKGILDRSGESLISGWNIIMVIISTVFEGERDHSKSQPDQTTQMAWNQISNELISSRLGAIGFDALRSICSEFLVNLPPATMPSLIEILHRFMGQREDLNLGLAALNIVWALSDLLSQGSLSAGLETLVLDTNKPLSLEQRMASQLERSRPTQWLLLLLRLREAVRVGQPEIRKAAFQTICSICKDRGRDLSPDAWRIVLSDVVLGLLNDESSAVVNEQHDPDEDPAGSSKVMIGAIVSGTAAVLVENVLLMARIENLPDLWQKFMSSLGSILNLDNIVINAVVHKSLATILVGINPPLRSWQQPVHDTFTLWARWRPQTHHNDDKSSNQPAFAAYTDLALQLHRLTTSESDPEKRRLMINNIFDCLRASDASFYNADVTSMSPLQIKALDLFQSLSKDPSQPCSTLIPTAAKVATLHKETANQDAKIRRPSYIALAAEGIQWLQALMLENLNSKDGWDAGAQLIGLTSLSDMIEAKYSVKPEYNATMVWKKATMAVTVVIPRLLACVDASEAHADAMAAIWKQLVRIVGALVNANGLHTFHDVTRIYQDQLADIEALEGLCAVVTPALGNPNLPDELRTEYAKSLFQASIIHQTEAGELPSDKTSPLENINKIRRGRVKKIPFSQREQMSYVCLSELIALSSVPANPAPNREKLAQAAAPWLILRLAIPIRAYIADQPLRGRAPQPLSELEELLFCLEQIGKLGLHPDALPGKFGSPEKAHLVYLYPLLAKAVSTAGDRWSGADEVLEPLQAVLESLNPFA